MKHLSRSHYLLTITDYITPPKTKQNNKGEQLINDDTFFLKVVFFLADCGEIFKCTKHYLLTFSWRTLWRALLPLRGLLILAALLWHIPQEQITARLWALSPLSGWKGAARHHPGNRTWSNFCPAYLPLVKIIWKTKGPNTMLYTWLCRVVTEQKAHYILMQWRQLYEHKDKINYNLLFRQKSPWKCFSLSNEYAPI